MKALVTGANGHLGSNLVRDLSRRGYHVVATVRSLEDHFRNAPIASLPNVEVAELDIRDADRFRFLCDHVDLLFHVAATYAYVPGLRTTEEDIVADSLEGADAAIRAAARQVRRMVLTSSIVAVPLRLPSEPPATEADWQTDMSVPYIMAKTEAERRAWELADRYGVDLVTVLPGAILGPGFLRGTPSTDLIEGIMLGALRFGAPRLNFPAVDVRDIARGHILAAESAAGGRFLLCGDSFPGIAKLTRIMHAIDPAVPAAPFTLPDVFGPTLPYLDWLNSKLHDSPLTLTAEFARAVTGRQFNASNARAKSELGWVPEIPLRQTLAETMDIIRTLRRNAGRKI